nr:stressosome-associated protein Prli42 [Anoxybacillus amylolyticus]
MLGSMLLTTVLTGIRMWF